MNEGMQNITQIEAMGWAGYAVYAMSCENWRLAQRHLIETLELIEDLTASSGGGGGGEVDQ